MSDALKLVRKLRTTPEYRHPVQIMLSEIDDDLLDKGEGGFSDRVFILGQGDYPTGTQIVDGVVRDMNAAADTIEALQSRCDMFEAALRTIARSKLSLSSVADAENRRHAGHALNDTDGETG